MALKHSDKLLERNKKIYVFWINGLLVKNMSIMYILKQALLH